MLHNTVTVAVVLVLVHFEVVDLQIRNDLRLTLHLLVLVALQLLHFVVLTLVSESNHGAEEYVQRLLQDVILLQALSVDGRFALSPLIQVVDILNFKGLVPRVRRRIVDHCFPPELLGLKHLLHVRVCMELLATRGPEMVQVESHGSTMHELPNIVHSHVQKSFSVLRVNRRQMVQQYLDGRPPIGHFG